MNTVAQKTIPIRIQKQIDELKADIHSLQDVVLKLANQVYYLTHGEQSK